MYQDLKSTVSLIQAVWYTLVQQQWIMLVYTSAQIYFSTF